ncbi:MAG: response regulator [Oligoflexia bacterium]|nr:response regulator [Oligoflexia bacterium]
MSQDMNYENIVERTKGNLFGTVSQTKILIVEDTAIQAKKLKFYLEKLGYDIVWAENGKLALDELNKNRFNLVITDVQMPEMSGLEMLVCIRSNSKIKNVPVIVITTLDNDEICEQSMTLGADDFIAKPFHPREINLRIQNILERKRAEEFTKIQLNAIESSMDGMAILNQNGQYIYVNEAQVKVFGYIGSDDFVGNYWETLYNEEEIKRLTNEIWPQFKKDGKWFGEIIAKRKDGTNYEQEVSLTMIDNGKFISICRDISERKRLEREKEILQKKLYLTSRLASIGGLAAGVAQEISVPLNELLGQFSTLRKMLNDNVSLDPSKMKTYFGNLGDTISTMTKIVNGLRDYSSVSHHQESKEMDVHKIIRSTIELVGSSIQQKNIKIGINFLASKYCARGDTAKFGQVILNMLFNAKESFDNSGEEKSREIKVNTMNADGLLIIEIADNGIGIADEIKEKIFDNFFTTKSGGTNGAGAGTGLGLTICKTIIDEMKGVIVVDSKLNVGTKFTIKIPCLDKEFKSEQI